MAEYEELCESILTLRTTKLSRYPRQIQLSEEFLQALKGEVDRFMVIDEDKEKPIRKFEEKFMKALRFEIVEHCGQCHKDKKKKRNGSKPRSTKDSKGTDEDSSGPAV